MIVWRRWVFPILMVLVFGLIAASLAKLAFFDEATADPEQPSAVIMDPVVEVTRGTVTNQLVLQATVARDDDVTVRSELNGTVVGVHASTGADVSAGQALLTVRQDDTGRHFEIQAPEAGKLLSADTVIGQSVTVGGEVAKLSPARFHVLGTVQPVQLYRLLAAPGEGTVTITGGPAPFTCTGLGTQVAQDGTTSVICKVPGDQVVFPGLPAELTIDVGVAEDVLVVPATAVKGGSGSGLVWVDAGDGSEPVERQVKLGVTDGALVEVLEGLEEGEQIRQFVPGSAAPVEEFCYEIAPGQEFCETGVSW
jgi:multidrug efflux pump subunit AcrA (membrane-fusion protein)